MSIRRNTLYNLAGSAIPTAVTLLTVPVYLNLIGEARYGILAIAWLLLGYFGLFDLGLSRATSHAIAQLADAPARRRAETFWTALMFNAALGVLGGLVFLPVAFVFFGKYFNLPSDLKGEAMAIVPWLAVALPMATVTGVLTGALQGRQCFLALNIINVSGTILSQILPLLIAWQMGPSLGWLVPATMLGRVVVFFVFFERCVRQVPLSFPPRLDLALAKPLFAYGGWVTVTAIVGPLMVTFDRFLIGAIVGAKAVAWYTIPYNLVLRGAMLSQSLTGALFPRIASAKTACELERLTDDATMSVIAVTTPVTVAGILMMEPFLVWWISPEFAGRAADVGHLIALGLWTNALARIPFTFLQGRGRPDLCAKLHLVELLPYVAFLVLALRWWGVTGAAALWSLRTTVDAVALFALVGQRPKRAPIACSVVLLATTATAVLVLPLLDPLRWAIGIGALAFALILAWWCAPAPLRAMVPFLPAYRQSDVT